MIFEIVGLIILFVGGIWGYLSERATWNDGICEQTGKPWIQFDTDSQGGKMFKSGDFYCSISWPSLIKKEK